MPGVRIIQEETLFHASLVGHLRTSAHCWYNHSADFGRGHMVYGRTRGRFPHLGFLRDRINGAILLLQGELLALFIYP